MNDASTIRVAELFAGIGGFRAGLERANNYERSCFSTKPKQEECEQGGQRSTIEQSIQLRSGNKPSFRVVWANEWDKYACQIYRNHWNDQTLLEGDIRKVKTDNIPDFDLLVGGFPCQPFSLAGKRQGFQDIRGTLFYEIVRIAEVKRPPILFLENVDGLRNHDNGETFETILRTLGDLGYWYEYQVLNSKYFGVPQNRERVFIIGHSRAEPTRQIFPIGESNSVPSENAGRRQRVASCLDANYHKGARRQRTFVLNEENSLIQVANLYENKADAGRIYDSNGIARSLKGQGGGLGAKTGLYLLSHTKANIKQRHQERTDTWTLDGSKSKMGIEVAQALQTDGFLRSGSSLGTDKPQSSRNIRRLTPTECERLQGFPDGWTQYGIEYKQVQQVSNVWQRLNAQWKVAQETALSENQDYVLCITNAGEKEAIQNSPTLIPASRWNRQNASIVIGLANVELKECVCDITNLGKDTVMLCKQNETSPIEQLTKKNLISERMVEKSTYPLLNLLLDENCPKAKLCTILTSIKEIIELKTCISAQIGKPITSAIIRLSKLPSHYSQTELSPSKMAVTVEISDTQRYKCLGNAVTVPVISFLGQRILESLLCECMVGN